MIRLFDLVAERNELTRQDLSPMVFVARRGWVLAIAVENENADLPFYQIIAKDSSAPPQGH